MDLSNFTNTMGAQMNNPECSLVTGIAMGNFMTIRWVIAIMFFGLIFQITTNLVQTGLDWLKAKWLKAK